MEILATLHPDNNPNDDLFPNVKKENIPLKAINLEKLSDEVKNKLPKVISSDTLLPATKLKYLEIDGITYYIPQRVDVTSNIKITGNKNDILSSPKNLLCILSGTSSLAIKVVDKIEGGSEEISTLSEVLPQGLNSACCATHGNYIYIFGGGTSSGLSNAIYKFNTITKTIETLSVTLPKALSNARCSIYNENIYIFGGYNNGYSNTIYKFNCSTESITTLSVVLPQGMQRACCSINNGNIYIYGGYRYAYLNTIYQFATSFELIANNVLIYNSNSNYSFDLITDQVTIPIKNIYIGDSNNTAQLANAYLYDEAQSAWVNVNTGEVLNP